MSPLKKRNELAPKDRPENKVFAGAIDSLSDVELLATFIGSGVQGANAKQIAKSLLEKYGSSLLTVAPVELTKIRGIGRQKAAKLAALFELVCRLTAGSGATGLRSRLSCVAETGMQYTLFEKLLKTAKPTSFTFIDLFAGIGGIRKAFEMAGGKSVFSCEWDKYAKQTYESNFGEIPFGDIKNLTRLPDEDLNVLLPDHDVLTGGFPCQPFSLAGVSKKNSLGRKHGFEDPTQGTLFFDVKRILMVKRPKAFFLENVKNLLHHDKGNTFAVIQKTLEEDLGYIVNWKIVDGGNWVPQHRERIFIVGYDPKQITITKDEIKIPSAPTNGYVYPELCDILEKNPGAKYTLGPGTWETLERHKAHHAKAGNGFGYGLHNIPVKPGTVTRTLSARYHKDGAEVLIEQKGQRPRKLTILEAKRLMGFPDDFKFGVSDTQAYHQLGNAVIVPAVAATAREIAKIIAG